MRMDFNKSVPQPFADFFTRAKLSKSDTNSECTFSVKCRNAVACVIDSKTTELSGHIIMRSCASFKGANIALISLDLVCLSHHSKSYVCGFLISLAGMHKRNR